MRTVIVDDEKQIREGLRILLSKIEGIVVVGEAANEVEAKRIIDQLRPDLVLLDIQLKNATGFDMLEMFSHQKFKLIFITAHNEFAIKAFKYNAFDYLLKPIDPVELRQTIDRLKHQIDDEKQIQRLQENKEFEKITIKTSERIYVLLLSEIIRCEADQGYTHFYMENQQRIVSAKTLKEYNALLPEDQFVRVHQSHLVNKRFIASYDKKGFLVLKNNQKVPVSVRKRHFVNELLKT